jgi:2-haloacid dehalogenase
MVALTNSTPERGELQLTNAGLRPFFRRVLSADSVRRLKSAREPYQMAARELGITTNSLTLVAAHSWDIAGAAGAGCATAFLARPGQVLDALTPKPNFIASDLRDLADQLHPTQCGAA